MVGEEGGGLAVAASVAAAAPAALYRSTLQGWLGSPHGRTQALQGGGVGEGE